MPETEQQNFEVMIDGDAIMAGIDRIAGELTRAYGDFEEVVMVSVVEGARMFCRELVRRLPVEPEVREIRASSYGNGTVSAGEVELSPAGEAFDVGGRTVLIVEDIVDTGRTVERLGRHFLAQGARDVDVVTLLTKPARREVDVEPRFVGFEIEDRFVIGFGMDFAGRYRELPHVAIYSE